MHCMRCGRCCTETEMLLSCIDIQRLEQLGYKVRAFAWFDKTGYARLRNKRRHCVFYNVAEHSCKVYPYRPEGCRLYPIIYDDENGIIVDCICSASWTVSTEELSEKSQQVLQLLKRIDEEALNRRTSKQCNHQLKYD